MNIEHLIHTHFVSSEGQGLFYLWLTDLPPVGQHFSYRGDMGKVRACAPNMTSEEIEMEVLLATESPWQVVKVDRHIRPNIRGTHIAGQVELLGARVEGYNARIATVTLLSLAAS